MERYQGFNIIFINKSPIILSMLSWVIVYSLSRCFKYSSNEGAADMDLRESSSVLASGSRVSAIPPAPLYKEMITKRREDRSREIYVKKSNTANVRSQRRYSQLWSFISFGVNCHRCAWEGCRRCEGRCRGGKSDDGKNKLHFKISKKIYCIWLLCYNLGIKTTLNPNEYATI